MEESDIDATIFTIVQSRDQHQSHRSAEIEESALPAEDPDEAARETPPTLCSRRNVDIRHCSCFQNNS